MTEPGDTESSRPLTAQEATDKAQDNLTRSKPIDFTDVENPLRRPLQPGEDTTGRTLPNKEEVEKRRLEVALGQVRQMRQEAEVKPPQAPEEPRDRLRRLTENPPEKI